MRNFVNTFFVLIAFVGTLSSQTININIKDGTTETYLLSEILNITFSVGETGTITDIDGNVYQTVKIGDQWWMVENLRVTHYQNGDPIPNVNDNSTWGSTTSGAYCNYNNNSDYVSTYGRLYNWYAADDSRNIAPQGWRVPTDDDWKELERFLGMSVTAANGVGWRGNDEGGKLKQTGTAYWNSPNTGATNESGFTALPAGSRNDNGVFDHIGRGAPFWTSSQYSTVSAYKRYLAYDQEKIYRDPDVKRRGYAIRCVKN